LSGSISHFNLFFQNVVIPHQVCILLVNPAMARRPEKFPGEISGNLEIPMEFQSKLTKFPYVSMGFWSAE